MLRRFFGWCVERHLIETNPAAAVRKPSKEQSRSRALTDDELREVWLASEKLGWPFGPFVRALVLTGQRRNEVAGMTWPEIDVSNQQWVIPAARTKNGKEHIVPLSPSMRVLLDKSPRFASASDSPAGDTEPVTGATDDEREGLVFTTTGKTPISGFSRAKANLDLEIVKARRSDAESAGRDPKRVKPMPGWTLHDLRRSCATGMGQIGIYPHVIETVLNHSSGFRAGIAGVYQRQPYQEERRQALDLWAAHLTRIVAPREPKANVISFRGARA